MFLRATLLGILELLQDANGSHLSEEVVTALGFVFLVARNSKPCTLLDLAVSAAPHSGYSKVCALYPPPPSKSLAKSRQFPANFL